MANDFYALRSHITVKRSLQSTSSADLLSSRHTLRIPIGIGRDLDLLAKLADIHRLPAADVLHLGKELGGRAGRVHVSSDVGVVDRTLLEDADAVVVGADGIMGVFERLGDLAVGIDQDVGLFNQYMTRIDRTRRLTSTNAVAIPARQP